MCCDLHSVCTILLSESILCFKKNVLCGRWEFAKFVVFVVLDFVLWVPLKTQVAATKLKTKLFSIIFLILMYKGGKCCPGKECRTTARFIIALNEQC